MRSLTFVSTLTSRVKGKKPEARYTGLAVRPDDNHGGGSRETVYVAAERNLPDGGVEIQIFAVAAAESWQDDADGDHVTDTNDPPIASFQAPPEPPFERLPDGKHLVSFRYLAESDSLVVILAGGDILVVALDQDLLSLPGRDKLVLMRDCINQVDVVGSVEAGIKAAQWSPDEELLVLVTGEDNVVEMTKTFDVLAEVPLKTGDFGQDKPVDVGWGAQTTQFHGSIGKSGREAVAGLPAATKLSTAGIDGDTATTAKNSSAFDFVVPDDTTYRISWRGDGAFFVISCIYESQGAAAAQQRKQERRLRFFSRTAVLQSTSEPTPMLEGSLAWQPSGSIIASSANNASQIVFFERNGLRRYEFALKQERPEYGSVIRQLAWNSDSSILAVWLERHTLPNPAERHSVQLWRRNNYHWYLKQSIRPDLAEGDAVQSIEWSAEEPLSLFILSTGAVEKRSMVWDTYAARRAMPHDSGAVAVVDGSSILLTPFRHQNVPPPMSALSLPVPQSSGTPVHIAFATDADALFALSTDGTIDAWQWSLGDRKRLSYSHIGRVNLHEIAGSQAARFRQLAVTPSNSNGNRTLYLLGTRSSRSTDCVARMRLFTGSDALAADPSNSSIEYLRGIRISSLRVLGQLCFAQTTSGEILDVSCAEEGAAPLASFPTWCPYWQVHRSDLFFGLSEAGKLYANQSAIATSCTSFSIEGDFLIYTTLQHEARFVLLSHFNRQTDPAHDILDSTSTHPLKVPATTPPEDPPSAAATYGRRVERGSRIVTVVPSSMSVVLQMPRGNLETICPRPLVLQVIRAHLEGKRYKEAFLICRRHRIDLNLLCDHDYEAFQRDVTLFVEQIASTEYLNLFISGLKNTDVTHTMYRNLITTSKRSSSASVADKVNTVCHKVRSVLEVKDLVSYASTIITTYACQQPSDLESALRVVSRVRPLDAHAAEEAVKYAIFLADANQLFDVALGMYDFELVLAVAQNSQKDPKEYLPFLRELRGLDTHYQHFKIDDHLRKPAKALESLSYAGPQHFQELLVYMRIHELYDEAVTVFRDRPDQLQVVLDLRGDWLMKDDRCHEAALSYTLANQPRKAMIAHQRAMTWQELFDIACQERLSDEELLRLAQQVASGLQGRGRFTEAARVYLDYGGNDVCSAVVALCEGGEFAEALRIVSQSRRRELVKEVVLPSMLETHERLLDEVSEIREQVDKQAERLAILRERRLTDAAGFYGNLLPPTEEQAAMLENVDVQTDAASTIATTQFTRYTAAASPHLTGGGGAGSVRSGRTRKSSASNKKALKKAASGAKGSIYEESYLLGSLTRLVQGDGGRLATLVASSASLNRQLVRLSSSSTSSSLARHQVGGGGKRESTPSHGQDREHEYEKDGAEEVEDGSSVDLQACAGTLERSVSELLDTIHEVIDEVWDKLGDAKLHDLETALKLAEPTTTGGNDGAAIGGGAAAAATTNDADDVELLRKPPPKPTFAKFGHWKVSVLDLLLQKPGSGLE